jgi:hypothetical protein
MALELKVRKIGNSLGIVLPKEVLASVKVLLRKRMPSCAPSLWRLAK